MPSQQNIKSAEILLNKLSELETYFNALAEIEKGIAKETSILVTVGNSKYIYGKKDLKESNLLSTLINQAYNDRSNLISQINNLLNG